MLRGADLYPYLGTVFRNDVGTRGYHSHRLHGERRTGCVGPESHRPLDPLGTDDADLTLQGGKAQASTRHQCGLTRIVALARVVDVQACYADIFCVFNIQFIRDVEGELHIGAGLVRHVDLDRGYHFDRFTLVECRSLHPALGKLQADGEPGCSLRSFHAVIRFLSARCAQEQRPCGRNRHNPSRTH